LGKGLGKRNPQKNKVQLGVVINVCTRHKFTLEVNLISDLFKYQSETITKEHLYFLLGFALPVDVIDHLDL
jgi:hypothetical protein